MKRLLLATLCLVPSLAFAQGQLTPPDGAVGPHGPRPTMKTLDQVEPRRPLCDTSHGVTQNPNGGFTISASGSYYLEDNLSVGTGDGIIIEVGNVSLDLSGFTIASFASPAGGRGINVDGDYSNIAIRNGHITGTTTYTEDANTFTEGGFSDGIFAADTRGNRAISVTGISVVGVSRVAIDLSSKGTIISACTASICAAGGFFADTVSDSSATTCGGYAIVAATVANCRASGVSTTQGMHAISADTATNCESTSRAGCGIRADSVTNCHGTSASGYGIFATSTATGSTGSSSTSIGIYAPVATGCNGTSTSGIGLQATTSATGCNGTTDSGSTGLYAGLGVADGTAENCCGTIRGATTAASVGLLAGAATNCFGKNVSGIGLSADVATGCKGTSIYGIGLQATQNATGCTGTTFSGSNGLRVSDTGAAGTAENCRGIATGGTGIGLSAETAANCFGQSTGGTGLIAATATNCSAYTASGAIAMSVAGSANNCRGNNGGGGKAIDAAIAVSCTSAHGAISATNKYNMP